MTWCAIIFCLFFIYAEEITLYFRQRLVRWFDKILKNVKFWFFFIFFSKHKKNSRSNQGFGLLWYEQSSGVTRPGDNLWLPARKLNSLGQSRNRSKISKVKNWKPGLGHLLGIFEGIPEKFGFFKKSFHCFFAAM